MTLQRTRLVKTYDAQGNLVEEAEVTMPAAQWNALVREHLMAVDVKSIRAIREGNSELIQAREAEAAALRALLVLES